MKHLFYVGIIAALAVLAFGCKTSKETTTSSQASAKTVQKEPQMLATINRTACYGRCPMYQAIFMDNGEVKYIGKRFVDNVGTYTTLLTEEEVKEIENQINTANYYSFDSIYPTLITDFPSCITEVNLNGKYKRVLNRQNPPQALRAYEQFLDRLLENRDWKKVSDEAVYEQFNQ